MKNIKPLLTLTLMLAGASAPYAAQPVGKSPPATAAAAATDMASGEVRKVDMDNKKITIRHGEIKNLDMPGMTMVFQVKDPAMLDKVKAGDKIRFRAETLNGAIVVTEMELAP